MQQQFNERIKTKELLNKVRGKMLVLTYNEEIGISDYGKRLGKRKCKRLLGKAKQVNLSMTKPVIITLKELKGVKNCISKLILIESL